MLGADTGALSAVRLSRLPCCERLGKDDAAGNYQAFADGPHLQRLLYLNPAPDGTPIAEQEAWPSPGAIPPIQACVNIMTIKKAITRFEEAPE